MDGILGDLLGRMGIRPGDRGDLRKEVAVSLEEAAFGAEKELTYDRIEVCGDCTGSGSRPGATTKTCPVCNGRGKVRIQQPMLPIVMPSTVWAMPAKKFTFTPRVDQETLAHAITPR